MYKAAGWTRLGRTKGYAHANGRYTDPHGVPKDLHVFPLHRDTRSRMCAPERLPDPLLPNPMRDASEQPPHGLSSVYEEHLRMPDFRRAQGRKHTIASVYAIVIAARLAGFETGIGTAQFAQALNQTELESIGAWFNPKTEQYEPPSKSVMYRVLERTDSAGTETVLKCWSTFRLNIDSALAADGKRLRGANRNGEGHFETATLVVHDTGLPVASHGFHDKSGERAAIAALFVNRHTRESHIQRSIRTHCGTEGQLGGAALGQPDLLDANQPCWPFRRCLMKRSFYRYLPDSTTCR